MKKSIVLLAAVALLAFALLVIALPIVSAQEATPAVTPDAVATLTFTQAEINNSFWVNNPPDPHLTDLLVDLQSANGGQVVLTAVYTYQAQRGGLTSVILRVTTVPEIVAGHVLWRVTAASADGKPLTYAQRVEVNAHLIVAWHRWVDSHLPAARFTDVAITDNDITFTFIPGL
jgi:hypothetical protein